jgi:GntR family transcriptional regulator
LPTFFTVDPRSGVPIYVQLIEQVKRNVAVGALAGGEQLPTVKALAVELTVNPNTVARAYRELERDGVIETSPGRGSFVRPDVGQGEVRRAVSDVAEAQISAAVREVRSLGVELEQARELIDQALARWYETEGDPK